MNYEVFYTGYRETDIIPNSVWVGGTVSSNHFRCFFSNFLTCMYWKVVCCILKGTVCRSSVAHSLVTCSVNSGGFSLAGITAPSPQLQEATTLCLCSPSLWCDLENFSRCLARTIKGLTAFSPSLRNHCPSCLMSIIFWEFFQIIHSVFSCFRWEGKFDSTGIGRLISFNTNNNLV